MKTKVLTLTLVLILLLAALAGCTVTTGNDNAGNSPSTDSTASLPVPRDSAAPLSSTAPSATAATAGGGQAAPFISMLAGDTYLYVLEFNSADDAKAFADFTQKSSDAWGAYHEYVQGKLVLEINVSQLDKFTADKESQLVSALFK